MNLQCVRENCNTGTPSTRDGYTHSFQKTIERLSPGPGKAVKTPAGLMIQVGRGSASRREQGNRGTNPVKENTAAFPPSALTSAVTAFSSVRYCSYTTRHAINAPNNCPKWGEKSALDSSSGEEGAPERQCTREPGEESSNQLGGNDQSVHTLPTFLHGNPLKIAKEIVKPGLRCPPLAGPARKGSQCP